VKSIAKDIMTSFHYGVMTLRLV